MRFDGTSATVTVPSNGKKKAASARERGDAETAAKEYRRAIFKNLHDAIFIHDLDGKVLDVNDKMLEMYRITREEALGLSIVPDYSAADDPELLAFQPALWKRVMAGEGQLFEYKARRPSDGSVFDVEVSLTKLSLPEGEFILATTRDISERKRVERELVATRNYLKTVFNNIHDAVFVHDVDGKVVDVNDRMLEIYQFTRDEAIGLSVIPDYALPDGVVDQPALWRKTLAGENQLFECTGRRPKDGHQFDVEVYLTKLSLPEGDFVLGNTREITERKRIEKELHAEKQRFQTLSEGSPVGMVLIDGRDGFRFTYMNPKFKEFFGYGDGDETTLHEWLQRTYPDAVIRRRSSARWMNILGTVELGSGRAYVRKLSGRDRARRYFKFTPVQLESGEILMTCWDITKARDFGIRIRERNLVLGVLNEIVSAVSGSLHVPEILETLKSVFAQKLKISAGGIFLCGEGAERARMAAQWGLPESARNDFQAFALAHHGQGKVIHGADVTLVRNRLALAGATDATPFKESRWQRYLSISLFSEGERQAMIFLVDRKRDSFSDDQMAFYKALGRQIGVAIQNARLFQQVQQSHAQMKALSLRLVDVQEAERRYIARELHDEIGQELTGLKLTLEMNALKGKGRGSKGLAEARSVVNRLMGLVRELSLNLRPAMLDDLGLLPTLMWHFSRFTNQTNIQVNFRQMGLEGSRFPLEIETALYRIIQEALTNVARHAKVGDVTVRLWYDGGIVGAQIEDGGVGFTAQAAVATGKTNGLDGMRERAILLGGHFIVESEPGTGTRLTAELPVGTSQGYDSN